MMAEQSEACHCACCRKNSRSSLELRELHARTLSEMRSSIGSLTKKYKLTLEAMDMLKRESEENKRLSAMAANSAQIHCDEIKNGLQAMSLDANELVQILSSELSSVKEERDKLKRNQDVLCSKLSSMSQPGEEERAVLIGEIQDLMQSRKTLQVSIRDFKAKCADLEARVASLQEENCQLLQREANVAAPVVEEDLTTKCADLEARVASLQEENCQLLQREAVTAPAVEDLTTKCSDLEARVAHLQEENAQLLQREADVAAPAVEEDLTTKCADLEARVASLQEENCQLLQREAATAPAVEDLTTKCSDLEARVAHLQEENAQLLQREADVAAPAVEEDLTTKCADLEARVASLQEENCQLLQREAATAPAVEDLTTKCSDLEARVASLQEENAQFLQPQTKLSPKPTDKLLRLTRENQQFAVKLSEQENKSKALESTIVHLSKYLDRELDNGEEDLFDILDNISYIKRTCNSREAREVIGMLEESIEKRSR